ncbi:hypothetical protein CBS101457_004998 [Exobasidium rhododendri]|nr:hypothetical protein CBS101457_004998 [Exobasidium rhododendri]
MGLRTRMYARLLEAQTLSLADDFEQKLWPFAPGAKQLRLAQFGPDPPQPSSSLKEVEKEREAGGIRQNILTLDIAKPVQTIAPIPESDGISRGIVMSLGRSEVRFAMQFLHMLRNVHKSSLPVELYYYGEDDLPTYMRAFLEMSYEGVRTIDLEAANIFDPSIARLARQGWALKPFALLATNFSEVILTDADVVFLLNPSLLFEVKGYHDTGTLFFHDRDHYREGASRIVHEFLHEQLGAHGPSERLGQSQFWSKKGIYEQESGVVVIDKRRGAAFSALFFAAWQNTGNIRELTTYRVFWGDKESYWLAFELAGFDYYFVDLYAGGLGNEPLEGQFCSDHPLHFLPPDAISESDAQKISSSDSDAVAEDAATQEGQGRAAWFNGSLLANKGRNETEYLQETSWAVDGSWEFHEASEKWCMPNATYSGTALVPPQRHQLLEELIDAAKAADAEFALLGSSLQ